MSRALFPAPIVPPRRSASAVRRGWPAAVALAILSAPLPVGPAAGAPAAPAPAISAPAGPSYATIASLTLRSDVVLAANIRKVERISAKRAPDLPPGRQRFLVQAEVRTLVSAPHAVPQAIRYLWDVDVPEGGKAPKIKGRDVVLFLRSVEGSDSLFQLADRNAQQLEAAAALGLARAIAGDPIRPRVDAMRISDLLVATPLANEVTGERSTTFLLGTDAGGTMSAVLNTDAQGGQQVILIPPDTLNAGLPVKKDSLAWYVLACGLPDTLPDSVVDSAARTGDSVQVVADYLQLKRRLGPCR